MFLLFLLLYAIYFDHLFLSVLGELINVYRMFWKYCGGLRSIIRVPSFYKQIFLFLEKRKMLPYVGVLNICTAGGRRKAADEVSSEKGEIMRAIPSEVALIIELPLTNRLTNFETPSEFPFFFFLHTTFGYVLSSCFRTPPFDNRSTTDHNTCYRGDISDFDG